MEEFDFLLWYARRGPGIRLRRSAFRKFCRRHRGEVRHATTRDGVRMETTLGDSVDNAIFVHGEFEPTTTQLFRRLAPHVRGLVDVGCNIGYFTTLFSHLRPGTPVIAVDANPRMIERTQRNLELNAMNDVVLVGKGLAGAAGTMTLHVPRERHSLASFAYAPGQEKDAAIDRIEVEVTTLSSVLVANALPDGLFVKIDTEGFEYAVLSGLDRAQVARVDALLIEANHRNLKRAGIALADLLGFQWLDDFEWYVVDDPRAVVAPTGRQQLLAEREINANLLFVRSALKNRAGF